MKQFNFICSIILVVVLPLMIVILSSNLILRVSAPYTFHFNDSEVVMEVPYNVKGTEFADEISAYWSSFSDEPFQVHEDNGLFKDEIFEEDEQAVMKQVKHILNIALAAGLLCLMLTLGIYIYLLKSGFTVVLRKRYKVGAAITILLLIVQAVCWSMKSVRLWAYDQLIGLPLHKESVLALLLGDPSYVTYIIFATVAGGAMLAILSYVHFVLTRPDRIFY